MTVEEEAAELLPCWCGQDKRRRPDHGSGCPAEFRPAVAERLREDAIVIEDLGDDLKRQREHIAALEEARNLAEALVISHEGHIAKLEAAKDELRAALQLSEDNCEFFVKRIAALEAALARGKSDG